MITLVIGGVDVSDYVNVSSYNYSVENVYDQNTFVNYDGEEVKNYLGIKKMINLTLEMVKTSVVRDLAVAMSAEMISVTFTDLLSSESSLTTTADFERPQINSTLKHEVDSGMFPVAGTGEYEYDEGDYWDYSISLTSKLLPPDDGL